MHPAAAALTFFLLTLTGRAETLLCTRVVDGDTIIVQNADGTLDRVRLAAVDAPEKGQPGFSEARAYLASRVEGKRVRLEGCRRDRYRRRLAHIYRGRWWIQLALVKHGHAVQMEKYSHDLRLTPPLSPAPPPPA